MVLLIQLDYGAFIKQLICLRARVGPRSLPGQVRPLAFKTLTPKWGDRVGVGALHQREANACAARNEWGTAKDFEVRLCSHN